MKIAVRPEALARTARIEDGHLVLALKDVNAFTVALKEKAAEARGFVDSVSEARGTVYVGG